MTSPNPLLPSIPVSLTIGIVVVAVVAVVTLIAVWLAVRPERRK